MPTCIRVFLLLSVVGVSACTTVQSPPNVVLIISDDQAWTDFGFMGHPEIETPNLDKLSSESAVFTRGYVPGSLCRCSLATLVTGLYPHQHGITSNDPLDRTQRHAMISLIQDHPTLPGLLQKKGYLSLQTGKWWEGNYSLGGFTHGMTHGDPERGGRHGDEGLTIGREGMEPITKFIDECDDNPFFLWYAPFLPHRPHNPPEQYLSKYQKPGRSEHVAKYWAMCEWFDATCGELLDYLDEKGLKDNTVVAFVADNGWIQQTDDPNFAPRSKRSPYDGGLRTPIMLRWPGKIRPTRDDHTLVTSLDIVTSILHACDLQPEEEMPGRNLLEIYNREVPPREAIFGEVFRHDAVDIRDPAASLLFRWCIDGSWKLILPKDGDVHPELYNLRDDPTELTDLASQFPQRVEEMTQRIENWWPAHNATS